MLSEIRTDKEDLYENNKEMGGDNYGFCINGFIPYSICGQ